MHYLDLVDRNTPGPRDDVTPIFRDHAAFEALLQDCIECLEEIEFETIAAIDALGFILGAGLAVKTHKPLIPIRKGGKLPVVTRQETFVDYSGCEKKLEIRPNALHKDERVVLVDEWIETGAQVTAAARLVEACGAQVAAILTIHLDLNQATRSLRQSYKLIALSSDEQPMGREQP